MEVKPGNLFIHCCATGLRPKITYLLLIACLMVGAPSPVQAQAPRSPTPAPAKGVVEVQIIAKGLEHPWSLAFLPDKRLLVTERPGRLRLVGRTPIILNRSPVCRRYTRAGKAGF